MVPRGFSGFPIEEFVGMSPFASGPGDMQMQMQDMSGLFGNFQGFDQLVSADRFRVESTNGNFKLRAELPGYSIHCGAESKKDGEDSNPLRVEVVGRSLVVRGQKTDNHARSSFQRSFQLPQAADVDKINAVYHDGVLSVDVPAGSHLPENAEESDNGEWTLNSQEGGSHSTITFSMGGGGRTPGLRGGQPVHSMLGDLMGLLHASRSA
nr:small heat shock protein sHsp22.3 [Dinophyceae sp.]